MNHFKKVKTNETANCIPVVMSFSDAIYSHQSRQTNENKSQVLNVNALKIGITAAVWFNEIKWSEKEARMFVLSNWDPVRFDGFQTCYQKCINAYVLFWVRRWVFIDVKEIGF